MEFTDPILVTLEEEKEVFDLRVYLKPTTLYLLSRNSSDFYCCDLPLLLEENEEKLKQVVSLLASKMPPLLYDPKKKTMHLKLFTKEIPFRHHTLQEITTLCHSASGVYDSIQDLLEKPDLAKKTRNQLLKEQESNLIVSQYRHKEKLSSIKKKIKKLKTKEFPLVISDSWDLTRSGSSLSYHYDIPNKKNHSSKKKKKKKKNKKCHVVSYDGLGGDGKGAITAWGSVVMTGDNNIFRVSLLAEKIGMCIIGISDTNNYPCVASETGYTISLRTAGKREPNTSEFASYGEKFADGDVIGIIIDMKNRQCSFTKNGKNLGVAFKNIPESVSIVSDIRKGKLRMI
ncbi:spry domain-containing socs box protein [Anaeramoeba flamelloides]|uniref:Spry domain-containing socs box protein n=1 Tax=Anaeramoeba flamelloides TaxID=1746091 RepID=A0ABQ8Y848_9EUKA|nr:spry domain-containing socs box protein [Anaeramoeba flamelloides]